METPRITHRELRTLLPLYANAGEVLKIVGDPGSGKTAAVREFAEANKLILIDARPTQLEPPQINGLEGLNRETKKTELFIPDWLPTEDDKVPEGYNGWLICWEELADADDCVLKALYRILNEKQVSDKKMLHPQVWQMATSNDPNTNCYAQPETDAIISRKADVYLTSDKDCFIDLCHKHGVRSEITSYLEFRPGNVNNYRERPAGVEKYTCERVWFKVNGLLKANPGLDFAEHPQGLVLLSSLMDVGTAQDFIEFLEYRSMVPPIKTILSNPEHATMPANEEKGALYALAGIVGDAATPDNVDALMRYVTRMPLPNQVIAIIEMTRRDETLLDTPPVENWIADNGIALIKR